MKKKPRKKCIQEGFLDENKNTKLVAFLLLKLMFFPNGPETENCLGIHSALQNEILNNVPTLYLQLENTYRT